MSGKIKKIDIKFLDEIAAQRIAENKELEEKINKLLEHLSPERHGMIFSSLLIQAAYKVGMPKEELLYIVSDLYEVARNRPN